MNIQITIERLDHWRELMEQYPSDQRTQVSAQRFKPEGSSGPDFEEIWTVNGLLAQHIQSHDPDWIV